jgi:hypothetical protein
MISTGTNHLLQRGALNLQRGNPALLLGYLYAELRPRLRKLLGLLASLLRLRPHLGEVGAVGVDGSALPLLLRRPLRRFLLQICKTNKTKQAEFREGCGFWGIAAQDAPLM